VTPHQTSSQYRGKGNCTRVVQGSHRDGRLVMSAQAWMSLIHITIINITIIVIIIVSSSSIMDL
jgi:hypothetical protein